jgi:hypothetical protein
LKNQKIDITHYLAQQEGLENNERTIKRLLSTFWQNPRIKKTGGLRLTEKGFEVLSKHFKSHLINFENPKLAKENWNFTNQLILRLDNYIDCPWYINHKQIWVFSDKMAVQLVLFSGDVRKFTAAKARSIDNNQE